MTDRDNNLLAVITGIAVLLAALAVFVLVVTKVVLLLLAA